MVTKKDLIVVVLATFCLTLTLFGIIPTRSAGTYDPWVDTNEDGKIDGKDIAAAAKAFGTLGDPTKNVNVTNWPADAQGNFKEKAASYVDLVWCPEIVPGENVSYTYATAGYRQVTFQFKNPATSRPSFTIRVEFIHGTWTGSPLEVDLFTVPGNTIEYRTYSVIGSSIRITIYNIDTNWGTNPSFSIYITA